MKKAIAVAARSVRKFGRRRGCDRPEGATPASFRARCVAVALDPEALDASVLEFLKEKSAPRPEIEHLPAARKIGNVPPMEIPKPPFRTRKLERVKMVFFKETGW